jgi:guanylate kinase
MSVKPTSDCLILIMGPAASGKTTIAKILAEVYHIPRLITYTTRAQRAGEKEGADYHFVSKETFQKMIDAHAFAEWQSFDSAYYGSCIEPGTHVLVITPQGYQKIKDQVSCRGFYLEVDPQQQFQRLHDRGLTEVQIHERIAEDQAEKRFLDASVRYIDTHQKTPAEIADVIMKQ